MREELLATAAAVASPEERFCLLKECIQVAVLRSLHESGAFGSIALSGSAALRFAGSSSDYATDLEFILLDKKHYKPEQWLFAAKRKLRFMCLDPRIAFARKLSTHTGWIKIPGILAEAGLARAEAETETLGFRIVIDITPLERTDCRAKLVEAAGECFAVRWIAAE